MTDPSSIRLTGPLARHRESLWAELLAQGYSPLSGKSLVRLMAHLSRWLEAQGLEPEELGSKHIQDFLQHRRKCGYSHGLSTRGLEPILRHLRGCRAVPTQSSTMTEPTALELLLHEFEGYLLRERAVVPTTARGYLRVARQFLSARFSKQELDSKQLCAGDVTSFVLRQARSITVGSMKVTVTALRSLLRYLHVQGKLTSELAYAVPAVASRRLAELPKALSPAEAQDLLRSCDRRTHTGRRNFAVLLLMLRLGLRRGEVAGLRLDDLDWERGALVISGKPRRRDRLPLPQDVGEAIVAYLTRGRPPSTSRQLFLRVRAPRKGLAPQAVSTIVANAGRRIGLRCLSAHRLRHTAATQMLRKGASLPQIAQVLRHRHADTTAIYAKVDRRRLRVLCRPWPGGRQ